MNVAKNVEIDFGSAFAPISHLGHPIQQTVLTLVKKENDELKPIGSGFIISEDGLMITARHVIDEIKDPQNAALFAIYIVSDTEGGPIPIGHIWGNNELDIVYMYLMPIYKNEQQMKFKNYPLSLLPPPIGTAIWGFGYYGMKAGFTEDSHRTIPELHQNTAITTGKVVEIHDRKRDSSFLTFPCFQTTCKFNHGMSGGPIFRSDTNEICGVICSGFEDAEDEQGFISYGSTIWPSLFINVNISLDGGPVAEYSMLDIAKSGAILTDASLAKISIEKGKIQCQL